MKPENIRQGQFGVASNITSVAIATTVFEFGKKLFWALDYLLKTCKLKASFGEVSHPHWLGL